jgi:ATP synthase protein I
MSLPPESREEAIARLNRSASDLETRTTREVSAELAGQKVSSEAYKIIAELLGGVFIGLGAGFLVDRFFGTNPWGIIGGVLLGFALSIYMARRTANRLMAQAKASGVTAHSVPFDDEADEDQER